VFEDRGSFSNRGRNFFPSPWRSYRLLELPSFLSNGCQGLLRRG